MSGSEESPMGSPQSASGSSRSNSPSIQHSVSPPGSPQSVHSGSMSGGGSPASDMSGSHRSRSSSPQRSFSGSPARSGSASSRSRSRSLSPKSGSAGSRSRSGSPVGSIGSRSRSPSMSPPGSPGTPQHDTGNRMTRNVLKSKRPQQTVVDSDNEGSVKSTQSHSSGSASEKGSRSRSVSPVRSRSGSPARSRSGSPAKSRSSSPARSRSVSPARSTSGSPAGSVGSRSRSPSMSPAPGSPGTPQHDQDEGERMTRNVLQKKKPQKVLDSDDEGSVKSHSGSGSEKGDVGATVDDLFGDASDISSDEDDKKKASGEEGSDEEDDKKQVPMIEDDENQEDQPPEEVPETRIEVEIPKVSTDLGSALHFVKLPNFLSVETRPYDPMTYEDEVDDDDVLDEEGRTRLRLKVENTVRWRKKKDEEGNELKDEFGEPIHESNSRVVKWSDGSMSLHLGNEIFDIHTMLLQADYNHLFIRQGTGLQAQSVFKTKLSFRPHSTDSFTHRKMTMSLADKSTKTQKVKVLPMAGADPEANKTEMIKKEEERLRASVRREAQQRRMKERAHSRGLNRGYLEDTMDDDDDENTFNIGAMKKAYKTDKSHRKQNIYSSDEDSIISSDSGDEEKKSKKLMKAKKIVESDDDVSVKSHSGSEKAHGSGSGESGSEDEPSRKKAKVIESDGSDEN